MFKSLKHDCIPPSLLRSLHWLPFTQGIDYKLFLLVFLSHYLYELSTIDTPSQQYSSASDTIQNSFLASRQTDKSLFLYHVKPLLSQTIFDSFSNCWIFHILLPIQVFSKSTSIK